MAGTGLEGVVAATTHLSHVDGRWIAHAFEQQRANRIIRPQSEYVGPRDRKWTPLAQRRERTERAANQVSSPG